MSVHVPERFRRRVLAHAITASFHDRYPLMLAIQGPPGDGKTFQLRHVLQENGFSVIANSSALLAGSFEAEPVNQLRKLYGQARDLAVTDVTHLPVLVLEDFDLSPAGREHGVRYTVNSQLLAAFLMNLADDVGACDVGTTRRFPIFLTGNNFSLLHQPLTRPGRMNVFSWEPTEEERLEILYAMLRGHIPGLERKQVDRLSKQHRHFPISFFDAALMDCIALDALRHVEDTRKIDLQYLRRQYQNGIRVGFAEFASALVERTNPQNSPKNYVESVLRIHRRATLGAGRDGR